MADVFLSYRSSDRPRAETVASWIRDLGATVWIDREVGASEEWRIRLEQELHEASVILVLWGSDALNSPEVRDEASFALKHNKLLQIHATGIPMPEPFNHYQAIRMQSWHGGKLHSERFKLICEIANRLGIAVPNELSTTAEETEDEFNVELVNAIQTAFYYCARQLEGRRLLINENQFTYGEDSEVAISFKELLHMLRAPLEEGGFDREGTLHRMVEDFLDQLELLAPVETRRG